MTVACHRGVSVLILAGFALLPVSRTVCATVCTPVGGAPAFAGERHVAAAACHEPVSGRAELRGTSTHECSSHGGSLRETTATLTPARGDARAVPATPSADPSPHAGLPPVAFLVRYGSDPPPGTASATRPPLILRI